MNDEERLHEERSAAGRRSKWDGEVIDALMSTPQGRFWTSNLIEFCRVYDAVVVDVNSTLVTTGRRQVGVHLLSMIQEHAPERYTQMIREKRLRMEQEQKIVKHQDADEEEPLDERTPVERLSDELYRPAPGGVKIAPRK